MTTVGQRVVTMADGTMIPIIVDLNPYAMRSAHARAGG